MDDMKTDAAKHHEDAARQYEAAANFHHDAIKQSAAGNFEKAERLATSAAEAETVANRHGMAALDLYRQHAKDVAEQKAASEAEDAARAAKHAARE